MRNLKKILALVLALMMTLSLMVTANASNYTDGSKISDDYSEAVEVLTGMGVFQGDNKGQFLPDTTLNRKDAAVLVYRLISGDVEDEYLNNYKGYAAKEFSDVSASAWYEPYVAYAVNGNYIKGDGKGHFNPDADITGTEVLTILLRAVGYDQNGEFSKDWPVTVATLAKELGITDTVSGVLLTKAVSREVVAELIFQTITKAYTVKYTPAFGYQPIYTSTSIGGADGKITLGYKVFELVKGSRGTIDDWGRPGYTWTYNTGDKATDIYEAPLYTYNTKVTECQISDDAFKGKDHTVAYLYVNGDLLENQKYTIEATDVVTALGAQGRLTEVYSDRIVMIDTMLALVTNVTVAKYDAAGHQYQPSYLYLQVFDGISDSTTNVVLSSKTDWTYTAGSYLLVNPFTVDAGNNVNGVFGTHGTVYGSTVEIYGVAESFTGTQSVVYYRAGQHNVNGDLYNDANCYHKDDAAKNLGTYTWFKDQYGNLIGSAAIATVYSYGVIKSIQWFTQAGTNGYALATITKIDGTDEQVIVKDIATVNDVTNTNPAKLNPDTLQYALTGASSLENGMVATEYRNNLAAFFGQELYRIQKNANGTVSLAAVANSVVTGGRIGTNEATLANPTTRALSHTVQAGYPYIVTSGSTIPVDSTTQYLFWNQATYTYQAVTGYNNIPNYNADYVDYVLGADGRADYVYVAGTPVAANTAGLFYLSTTNSYYQVDEDNDGYADYYVLNGYFNGVAGTIKIDAALTTGTFTGQTGTGTAATPTTGMTGAALYARMIQAYSNNKGSVLFDVDITNGFVTDVQVVNRAGLALNDTTSKSGPYTGKTGIRVDTADNTNWAYYNGDTLTFSNGSGVTAAYNVTTATRVIGTLDAGKIYGDGYIIHVVYKDKNASEIYVYEIPATPTGPSQTGYYTLTSATMKDSGSSTFTVKAIGNAVALTDKNTTVTLYNAKTGYQVYSTSLTVTSSGTGIYTLTVSNTLTQGDPYYAVITITNTSSTGVTTVVQTLTTPVIEAQH